MKAKKGKAKVVPKKKVPAPSEDDDASEEVDEHELESEPEPESESEPESELEPAPPAKGKGKGKGKQKEAAPKKNANGKRVRFDTSDESGDDSDAAPRGKRSKRFNKSRADASDDDDDSDAATGGKRERSRSSSGHAAKHALDDDDDDSSSVDWSHFDPDRKPGPTEAPISLAARRIVKGGMKTYLPLHVFADDVVQAEQNSRAVSLTSTQAPKEVDAAVKETEATMLLWTKWNKRHVAALRRYKADPFIIKMFERHFDYITNVDGVENAWHLWRAYDIAMRKKVKGGKPPNIGDFDLKTWSDVLAEAATQQVANAAPSAAPTASSSKQTTSKSRGSAQGASKGQSSKQEAAPLKYDRCMICGSSAHVFDKDKKEPTACKPAWLTWSADKRYHVIRGTGHAVCFAFNSCTDRKSVV